MLTPAYAVVRLIFIVVLYGKGPPARTCLQHFRLFGDHVETVPIKYSTSKRRSNLYYLGKKRCIFVVLFRVMNTYRLNNKQNTLLDRNPFKAMVLHSVSDEKPVGRPIVSNDLFFHAIDVFQFFQVFVVVVIILHVFFNFLSHFSLNLWVLSHEIDHHA